MPRRKPMHCEVLATRQKEAGASAGPHVAYQPRLRQNAPRRICRSRGVVSQSLENPRPRFTGRPSGPTLSVQQPGAAALLKKALSVFRASLGEEHEHTAICLSNFGKLHLAQRSLPEANSCSAQSMLIHDNSAAAPD